jgi:hypothetical protein
MELSRLIKLCLIETYSGVCIGRPLPDMFPIQNGLKQGALSQLFVNFILGRAVWKPGGMEIEWDTYTSGLC